MKGVNLSPTGFLKAGGSSWARIYYCICFAGDFTSLGFPCLFLKYINSLLLVGTAVKIVEDVAQKHWKLTEARVIADRAFFHCKKVADSHRSIVLSRNQLAVARTWRRASSSISPGHGQAPSWAHQTVLAVPLNVSDTTLSLRCSCACYCLQCHFWQSFITYM